MASRTFTAAPLESGSLAPIATIPRRAPVMLAPMRAERFPVGASATIEELEGSPHALLARLREREPVSWLPAIGGWLVTRRDLALAAMRDAAAFTVQDPRFTTAQVVGPSMLSLDGPEHDRHRAPFVAPLRLGAVRATLAGRRARGGRAAAGRARAGRGGGAAARLRRPAGGGGRHALARALARRRRRGARPLRRDRRRGQRPQRGPARAARRRPRRCAALGEALRLDATGDLAEHEYVSNAAVMLFGGIETTEGMIANAARAPARPRRRRRAARGRGRGVAAARAGRRGDRPLRDRGHRARRRGDRRGRPRADLDHRRQPRPGDVPGARPLRPRTRQRAAPPRVRGRAARVRRDAPRAPGGAHGARAAARAPPAAAPGSGAAAGDPGARVPQAPGAPGGSCTLAA